MIKLICLFSDVVVDQEVKTNTGAVGAETERVVNISTKIGTEKQGKINMGNFFFHLY